MSLRAVCAKQSPTRELGDCFGTKTVPRNDNDVFHPSTFILYLQHHRARQQIMHTADLDIHFPVLHHFGQLRLADRARRREVIRAR